MSFYDDIETGFCCATCGQVIDYKETGYIRYCKECKSDYKKIIKKRKE